MIRGSVCPRDRGSERASLCSVLRNLYAGKFLEGIRARGREGTTEGKSMGKGN